MRTRRSTLLGLIAVCGLVASSAQANEYSREGLYIGINGVYGHPLMSSTLGQLLTFPPQPTSIGESGGVNVRAGRRMNRWLAFELQYEWMNPFQLSVPGLGNVGQYEPDTLTVNAKGYLPFWIAQPYVLVGGGLAIFKVEMVPAFRTLGGADQGFAFRGGGGLDFYVTKNIVVNVEATVVMNTSNFDVVGITRLKDLHYVSAGGGIQYRF